MESPTDASCRYSWECKPAAAASHDSRDAVATPFRSIWPPGTAIFCHPPPASSYRDFPSHASRRASCRYASGSADVARLLPCHTGLPELPWRYAPEVVSLLPRSATSSPDPTSAQRARAHQPRALSRRSPSSAFPRITIGQSYLAMNDRAEVCPLSRRAMSQPVSRPLQPGVRFLRIPLPTAPTAFLAVRLPLPAARWAYPVPLKSLSGADPSYSPAASRPWWPSTRGPLHTAYRLVQACQHVWLVTRDDVYRKFTCVGRTRPSLAPLRLCAGRFHLASRFGVPVSGGYVVPGASHRAVAGSACPGRERLMEQPVSSGHTFSSETETQATFRSHVHIESGATGIEHLHGASCQSQWHRQQPSVSRSTRRDPGCHHPWSQFGVLAGLRVQLLNGLGAPSASRPRYRHQLRSYSCLSAIHRPKARFILRGRACPMDNC